MFSRSALPTTDESRRAEIEAMYEKGRSRFDGVPEVTAEELLRLLKERPGEVVVVDVRDPQEQAVSMIDGAITREEFEAAAARYRGATVVPYCTVGGRSGQYARLLHESGWRVMNFRGSILAWTHVGGGLRDAAGPTRRVHVWSPKANLIAQGYEAVW
jgi:rhodanese-related sulfurtransferase